MWKSKDQTDCQHTSFGMEHERRLNQQLVGCWIDFDIRYMVLRNLPLMLQESCLVGTQPGTKPYKVGMWPINLYSETAPVSTSLTSLKLCQ